VAANFFVRDEAGEEAYLRTYFGEPAGELRRARFYLMRQALHVFYAMTFMLFRSAPKPIDPSLTAPDFSAYHRRLLAGEIDLKTDDARIEYAKVHMSAGLEGMYARRFADSLALVGGRES
jgi:hypothetical protein